MIFATIAIKPDIMKKLLFVIGAIMLFASCSTVKETGSARKELKSEKILAHRADIRDAVESRRFILKFDRLYFGFGGWAQIRPRANFLIIDGSRAIMSSAYLGNYSSAIPIHGIRVEGNYEDYRVVKNTRKGIYDIKLKVSEGGDSFDLYVTIGEDGDCTASVNSLRIQSVRYTGTAVPIEEQRLPQTGASELI